MSHITLYCRICLQNYDIFFVLPNFCKKNDHPGSFFGFTAYILYVNYLSNLIKLFSMKKNSRQSSTSQSSPSALPIWTPEGATILSAMEVFTSRASHDRDDERVLSELNKEFALDYLQQRLSLTRTQTQLVTHVLCHNAEHPQSLCIIEDLAELMAIHPLRMMQMTGDLDYLEDLGYLNSSTNVPRGERGWRVSKEARAALTSDQAFDPESLRLASNIDFLEAASVYIDEGMRYDPDSSIAANILRLMNRNTHLPVVANLLSLPTQQDIWFMVLMMVTLGVEHDEAVSPRDLERMLAPRFLRPIFQQIRQGEHLFAQKGYVLVYNQDGMAQGNLWTLSEQAWIDMLGSKEELCLINLAVEDDSIYRGLTRYQDITPKRLFFSGNTQDQVNRLTQLLQEEHYEQICQSLKQRGMPTGFCCLFYGTPGTGKTELVQQLAIATQRDLLQVDLSTLRDKFVGESEKQVKGIFDKYRALVRTQERAPILFFNEADAIFGNRMENTQRSVDKMENAIQNIILQEMEKLNGIMICTTNLTSCLDKAFDRRFLFKLEFEKPTNEARKQIWQSMLQGLNDEQATYLANHFDFSGGQIQNISRKQVINAIFSGNEDIDYEQVKIDCQNETLSRNNGRKIGF